MSLALYLDDCAYSKRLQRVLSEPPHSHRAVIPAHVGLSGAGDPGHFAHARRDWLIIVTKNPVDFEILHRKHAEHAGIFAIYQDNDDRDMSSDDIARAIQNVESAGAPIAKTFTVLNAWRY